MTCEITRVKSDPVYSRLAVDRDLGDLVELFVQEMPDRVHHLEVQARSCDWEQLARTAHQLKGAAGSYGFDDITPFAAQLEAAARDGRQEQHILMALEQLLDICRRVRSEPAKDDETVHPPEAVGTGAAH